MRVEYQPHDISAELITPIVAMTSVLLFDHEYYDFWADSILIKKSNYTIQQYQEIEIHKNEWRIFFTHTPNPVPGTAIDPITFRLVKYPETMSAPALSIAMKPLYSVNAADIVDYVSNVKRFEKPLMPQMINLLNEANKVSELYSVL